MTKTKKTSATTQQKVSPMAEKSIMLDDIHKKISSSAALNGGFDTLLHKIDKIEQSQGQLVMKVDKIHEAIYDPSDGIFSKIAESKLESTQRFSDVEKKLLDVSNWKTYKEMSDEKSDDAVDQHTTKLAAMEKAVDSLVASQNKSWSVVKWFLVAVGGGLITLAFSWLQAKLLQ
jgi:hypothetical protein